MSLEKIQQKARQISEGYGHHFLGTEHMFLAMLLEEPVLADALNEWDVSSGALVESVLAIAERGEGPPPWNGFPVSPRLTRCLKAADREAQAQGHKSAQPLNLLSAILLDARAIPSRVLREFGVELGALRNDLAKRAARPKAPPSAGKEVVKGSQRAMEGNEGPLDINDILGAGVGSEKSSSGKPAEKKSAPPDKDKKEKDPLAAYGQNLTQMAREGKLAPVIGRQDEIRRCLQILTRKGKNNPVLIGEAGVGKTSVAVGIAQRIAEGRVPEIVADREIWEISMTRLIAGAAYRGEFQERLQKIMDEVVARPNVILFIDELHMLVGAGDSKGGMDAGNILKPALARGDFPLIGATTTDEYRKNIEADPALERRFQPVLVNEPSEKECLVILEGLRERYEKHHSVRISDRALLAAIKLSTRFLPDRSLPDKAIDLLDEAASRVKLQQYSMSMSPEGPPENEVGVEAVAEVVSLWSGVPVTQLTQEETERLLHIEENLSGRVIGQDHAVHSVAQTIRVMRMGFGNPNRPAGVFLFLGPTGVGKTELARALAEFLFGSEKDMIRIDMSEYMEKHAISRLIGSPPGYVGHDEEGQLTSAVRTRPYSVVLLDEVEKAHSDVFLLFLQVFDDGRLTDSKGRTVNFTNTIIVMTSNVGSHTEGKLPGNPDDPDYAESVYEAVRRKFAPEFVNRIDEQIIFRPLGRESLEKIVDLQLTDVGRRVRESKNVMLAVEPEAREVLLRKGFSPQYGARPLKRAVQSLLVKPMAEEMLRTRYTPGDLMVVRADGDRLTFHRQDLMGGAPEKPATRNGWVDARPKIEYPSGVGLPGGAREIVDVPTAPPDLLGAHPRQTEDGARPSSPSSYRPHEGSGSHGAPSPRRDGDRFWDDL